MVNTTETIEFKRLNRADLFALNHFLKQHKEPKVGKADLAYWLKQVEKEIENRSDNQGSIRPINKIIGSARLIPLQAQSSFWLRGVFIDSTSRKQGLGTKLMQQLHQSITQEHENVYIYAFPLGHLQSFYEKLGYQLLNKQALPIELKQRYERAEQQNKGWLCMRFASQTHH